MASSLPSQPACRSSAAAKTGTPSHSPSWSPQPSDCLLCVLWCPLCSCASPWTLCLQVNARRCLLAARALRPTRPHDLPALALSLSMCSDGYLCLQFFCWVVDLLVSSPGIGCPALFISLLPRSSLVHTVIPMAP